MFELGGSLDVENLCGVDADRFVGGVNDLDR